MAGFTLLEALVALAILGGALAVMFPTVSNGLRMAWQGEAGTTGVAIAQSVLARVGADIPLQDGIVEGETAEGYRWHLEVSPYGEERDRRHWPLTAKAVAVRVSWRDSLAEESFDLTTIKLGAKKATP